MLVADRIAVIVAEAPAWVKLALTAPDVRLRERGEVVLSAIIASRLDPPEISDEDDAQLILPIL